MALQHKYTLVCDEVRREDNGKLLVLGLYTPGIVLPGFPVQLPKLTFLSYFEPTAPGTWQLSFRFSHLTTGAVAGPEGGVRIEVPQVTGPALVPIVIPNLNFQMPGDYAFTLTGQNFEAVSVIVPVSQQVVARVH